MQAWAAAVGGLESGAPESRFFCANLLLTRVRAGGSHGWAAAPAGLRTELTQHLLRVLGHLMGDLSAAPVVVTRVCLLLAAVAGRARGPVEQEAEGELDTAALVHSALQAGQGAQVGQAGEQAVWVVLALLGAVAEEAERLDQGRRGVVLAVLEVSCAVVHVLSNAGHGCWCLKS